MKPSVEQHSPLVSVIVPVYNAEKYIQRCCLSLFEQTLKSIEFIFIDDCSMDASVSIIMDTLQRYPNRIDQVKVLRNDTNKGVSYSRQRGLDNATGQFVIHCDSDDWVDAEIYESMSNKAIQENADIVCCGYEVNYESGEVSYSGDLSKLIKENLEFNISPIIGSVWNKLVRLSFIRNNSIRFPDGINWGEDFCVSIAELVSSSKTILVPNHYYHYWQSSDSITHTISKKRCDELVACAPYVESFLINTGRFEKYSFQLDYLKFQLKQYYLIYPDVRDIDLWLNTYPECNKSICLYNSPLYIKLAGWFIIANHRFLAKLVLFCRDIVSRIKTK